MLKRSILATAVATLTIPAATAAPYQPMDARGLAMGNTGVASAMRAHAPAYNPSMLAQEFGKDGFAVLLPQVGVSAADEKEMTDTAKDIADHIVPHFEDLVMNQVPGSGPNLKEGVEDLKFAINDLENTISNLPDINSLSSLNHAVGQLSDSNNTLNDAATSVRKSLKSVDGATKDLTDALDSISGNPLAAKVGLGTTLAIPSKKFSAAVSLSGTANISARVNFSPRDKSLLNGYAPAAEGFVGSAQGLSTSLQETLDSIGGIDANSDQQDINNAFTSLDEATSGLKTSANNLKNYNSKEIKALDDIRIIENGALTNEASDPNLESTVEVVAVAVVDAGISFAREFDFGGHPVAIGITPKVQKISTFHYGDEVDGFDDIEVDDVKEYQKDYTDFNLDIGASYRFGASNNWMAGAVVKNILGGSYEYADTLVTPKDDNGVPNGTPYKLEGGKVNLNPQVRGGLAYHSKWFNAAFDLDLMKNKAVAYEVETQYASLGIELDVFRTIQLRAGYRSNLVSGGTDVVSAGFGLSPFGVHIDLAAMANPSDYRREAGAVLDMGFYF